MLGRDTTVITQCYYIAEELQAKNPEKLVMNVLGSIREIFSLSDTLVALSCTEL
jgi:hypothetical protein